MTRTSSLFLMSLFLTFNLADRANLYFKVGNFVDITFDSEETSIDPEDCRCRDLSTMC